MQHGHVKGIGGPGAPHAFRLERLEDPGVDPRTVDVRFWSSRRFDLKGGDVIMRTKRWLSDDQWDPEPILFLPASVAEAAAGDAPPVFLEKPFKNDKENQAILKYATLMRREPFEMHSAADALEKVANGIFDDPFVNVSWALPAVGPAVGQGAIGRVPVRGRNLEAAPNQLRLVVDRPPREEVARFHRARMLKCFTALRQNFGVTVLR